MNAAGRDLRVLLSVGALGGLSDGQLLERFAVHREEAAFEALLGRHGPMVWGVCRRVLRHPHDAEDAFQAAFLVLARKAASIAHREMVSNWLYAVAYKTARRAEAMASRQRARERQVTEMPEPESRGDDGLDDLLLLLLDRELSLLPEKYRIPIVLCDLEGRTHQEAAILLDWPIGTVSGRLSRARAMLAKRLARRGVALTGGALAAVLWQDALSAGMPDSTVSRTIGAASVLAAGHAAAGVVSPKVAALTDGVRQAMLISKLKATLVVTLVLGSVATGVRALGYRAAAAQDGKAPAAATSLPITETKVATRPKQGHEPKEGYTAWGEEAGGLRAGIGFRPGANRAYRHGEAVTLVVRVRNVGKEEVKFKYLYSYLRENRPAVTDADGKRFPNDEKGFAGGTADLTKEVSLPPGEDVELADLQFELTPVSERATRNSNHRFLPLYGSGKVSIQYDKVFGNSMLGKIETDPNLRTLATGKLELKIVPGSPRPAATKKTDPAPPAATDKK